MPWNHRVLYDETSGTYAIHSAYSDEDGKIIATSEKPAVLQSETPGDLKLTLLLMLEAFEEPILHLETLQEHPARGEP